MFCHRCGIQLPDNVRFCNNCGTEINKQSQQDLIVKPKVKNKRKKSALKWIIPFIIVDIILIACLVLIIYSSSEQSEAKRAALEYVDEHYCSTFAEDADYVEKIDSNHYTVIYKPNKDYDFWQMTGTIKMSVYKICEEWEVEVEEENINYNFKEIDNWYYITAYGNKEFILKISELTAKEVKLEYYCYDMGSYNTADSFEHDTTYCDVKYDGASRSFTFKFMGDWRIYGHNIAFNRFEVGPNYNYEQYSDDFKTLRPINPEDYWWYEKAKW